ncbi:ester cyclase [Candidatus Leptofilum sp.]|uniref:nuclear transport factor 2 family protein n=1 Tax=Candidatus Leptofilum sp. TaxID=3241576 RepID=UPI003B59B914
MSMQNFAPEFETPEQYIVDITYIIWEEGNVGRIYDWYAPVCPVRSPHGVMNTVDDMVNETLEQMHVFTNRLPLADDVIIGDMLSGFYSSHRVRSVGRHMGDSALGPATKRNFQGLGIADCVCRDNRIVEEWKLRDHASFVRQLGFDPVAYGISLGKNNPQAYAIGNEAMRHRWADENGLTILGNKVIANRMIDTHDALWNGKQFNVVTEQYVPAVRFEGPDRLLSYGRESVSNRVASMMASLPDGRFEPHHLIVRQQDDRAVRVAMRWTFCGTHSGDGRFGAPTNAPVAILGISHFELHDGLIASEWMVVDETAIYAQIAAYQESRE